MCIRDRGRFFVRKRAKNVRTKGRFLYENSRKTYEKGAKFAQTLCLFREFFVSSMRKLSCQVRANFVSFSQVFRLRELYTKNLRKGATFFLRKRAKNVRTKGDFLQEKSRKTYEKGVKFAQSLSFSRVFRVKFAQTLHEKRAKGAIFSYEKGRKTCEQKGDFCTNKRRKTCEQKAIFCTKKAEKHTKKV